jgi:enoyl-CoA hydratase
VSAEAGTVRALRDGPAVVLTLHRPRARNALTWAMYEALERKLRGIEEDDRVRVVVLRGAGGSFAAGTDIAHFRSFTSADDGVAYERSLDRILDRLEALPVPTLAVVEGAAVGGGLALAAACDLRICTPDARFGVPIARTLGNCLSLANTARLVAHLGPSRTLTLLLLAELIGAEEARTAGFVAEVVPPAELDGRITELVARLASHAPITLQVSREAVRRVGRRGLRRLLGGEGPEEGSSAEDGGSGLDDEELLRRAYGSRDFREGVRAFLEKRPPRWEGR